MLGIRTAMGFALLLAFFIGQVSAQPAACDQEVRARCAQGGCPSSVVQELYTRCMVQGPRRSIVNPDSASCEQQVRSGCAQGGGCLINTMHDLYARCMSERGTTPPGIAPGSTYCGNGYWCGPNLQCGRTRC